MFITHTSSGAFISADGTGSNLCRIPLLDKSGASALDAVFYTRLAHLLALASGNLKNSISHSRNLQALKLHPAVNPLSAIYGAGVTYYAGVTAHNDLTRQAHQTGKTAYDMVAESKRGEQFFKTLGKYLVGPRGKLGLRSDAKLHIPEPELALYLNCYGELLGYGVGIDQSAADLEKDNLLYLGQAKSYDSCGAVGGAWKVHEGVVPDRLDLTIELCVKRGAAANGEEPVVWQGSYNTNQMTRTIPELIELLFRHNKNMLSYGGVLLCGTGLKPPEGFTLLPGDEVTIGFVDPVASRELTHFSVTAVLLV